MFRSILVILSLVALLSCSTTKKDDGGTGSGQILKKEELPARQREVMEAWQKGGAAWEIERENVRKDPELARFVVDNLIIQLVKSYERSRIAVPGQKVGPFERAQTELVDLEVHSTAPLVGMLQVKDGIVAFLCADTLKQIGARALPGVAALTGDERAETRRRALELLGELPHGGERETEYQATLGRHAAKDPEWFVRGQAALALGARAARGESKTYAVSVLSRALDDVDPVVGESAAKGLGTLGEPRAIPMLIEALPRATAAGRVDEVEAIQRSLAQLSGEKRSMDVEGWRAWWRKREAQLDASAPKRR
jgi:hypothetical protein